MQTEIWRIILLFFLVVTFTPFVCAEASPHEEAVALARSGKLKEAIQQLETLHKAQPDNNRIANDLIVIYCWNRQPQEACSLFEQRPIETYPHYVQIAAQKAYRDTRQPDQALEIVEFLLNQQKGDPDLLLFKGLLLVDKKELETARNVLKETEKAAGKDERYYRLSAYLHVTQQQWLAALFDYQHLSKLLPDDPEPSAEQFVMLRNLLIQWTAEKKFLIWKPALLLKVWSKSFTQRLMIISCGWKMISDSSWSRKTVRYSGYVLNGYQASLLGQNFYLYRRP